MTRCVKCLLGKNGVYVEGGAIIGIDTGRGLTRPPQPSFPDIATTLRRNDAAQHGL